MATKAKKTVAKSDDSRLIKLLTKELGRLREGFAAQAGLVSRLAAEQNDLSRKVKRLIKDPLYAVPQDLKKEVERLEAKVLEISAEYVGADAELDGRMMALEDEAKQLATAVAAHGEQLETLEAALTEPIEHGNVPRTAEPDLATTQETPTFSVGKGAAANVDEKQKAV